MAKPAVPFPELKARLERRMAHLGLKVTKVKDLLLEMTNAEPIHVCMAEISHLQMTDLASASGGFTPDYSGMRCAETQTHKM